MNDFTTIQSNNLTATPYGKSETSIASGVDNGLKRQSGLQELAIKQTELTKSNYQEANGPITASEVDSQLADLNSQMQKFQNYLKFERNEDANKMVIFIKDTETDEVIRQIPTENFLNISKSISQYLEMNNQTSEKVSPPVGMFTNETV